jgi:hypothetical protein
MQQMMSLLVTSVLAISAQNAIAGGLPETKTTDSTSVVSADSTATTATSTSTSASATSSDTSASATESTGTNAQTAENTATDSPDDLDETENGSVFVAIEDDPLIVDASAIMDDDGMGNVQVQWQISKDGETWMNLTGAVHQSFTPREAHVGERLRVQISYVD